MAGSYPDVPGYRFAYDIDGTVATVHYFYDGSFASVSQAALRNCNNDNPGSTFALRWPNPVHLTFLFPESRSINGILFNHMSGISLSSIQTSDDTTNGMDGTWSTLPDTPPSSNNQLSKVVTRGSIAPVSISNTPALKLVLGVGSTSRSIRNLHLYGAITADQSPDRLRIVDMSDTSVTSDGSTLTGEDIAAQLDFGNIPQRNSATRQFKVVNNSASQTANNITVSLEAPTDASPSLIGQYQISTDNVAFANAVNIGSLAPGADSGTLYLRNQVAANAELSVWSARILAQATDWS